MSYILRAGLYFLMVCAALGGASRPAQAQNSLWTTATIPANTDENDPNSVELGVKFKSSVSGTVSAIQFYKGPSNVGPHTVTLWNSYGTKLASTKSTNETASGWQTVTLEASINITEGEIYVASYHTPGFYAGDQNYFVAPYSNGPLTAPINAGVYNYGTSSGFPSSTWNHSNYWVDIAFMPSSGGTIANGACGSSNGASLTSAPTTNLCNAGTASAVTEGRPWGWSCAGSNGGTAAQCSAAPASLNGQCGPADGVATGAAPISGLCAAGQGSSVTGSGPWNWSCMGSNGGAAAQCSAPLAGSGDKAALLSSDRDASANWKMAGMLSVGGIPNRTTVCATVGPSGGGQDDSGAINDAINACPVDQVVSLTAGTFTVGEGNYVQLNKGVTLRGAGAGSTLLTRSNGAQVGSYQPGSAASPLILVGPQRWNNGFTGITNLTTDGDVGSNSIQVQSTAGFQVGQIVEINEASGASWQPDPVYNGQVLAAPDYRIVYPIHNPSMPGDHGTSVGSFPCWFMDECDRFTSELKKISSISGNTLTFDSPLTISYRVSHGAHIGHFQTPFTTNAGVENMSLSNGDDSNLTFTWAANSWAKNVESYHYLNDGIRLDHAFRVQLEGVYVHEPVWPVSGGAGYNIECSQSSSEFLIENSISVKANKVMVARACGAGAVVAYNYMDDGFINGSDGWIEIGLNGSHWPGSNHILFEGNQSFNIDGDFTWGNAIYHTFFRNYATGYRARFTDYVNNAVVDDTNQPSNGLVRAAAAHIYHYWYSFIGNVLGTAGHMSGWTYDSKNTTPNQFPPSPAVWMLGWMDVSPQGYDPNVAATAIRHGNYDFLSGSVVWDPNLTQTLPASLYLSQTPDFFNAGSGYTWPWVDSTGGVGTLPAKARYDAGTPFAQP